jgi:hypothetical protein
MGHCRIPCTEDDECPQEALCIGPGPLGCQLTWDAFCNMSQPCKDGLRCAARSCRMPDVTAQVAAATFGWRIATW